MALVPPLFVDSVVALGFVSPNGKPVWSASGFFFGVPINDPHNPGTYRVYLVTNKHVFAGQPEVFVRVNPQAAGEAKGYTLLLHNGKEQLWEGHPNKNVDVAIISVDFGKLRNEDMQVGFFEEDNHALQTKQAADMGLSEGDGVFVLGFPMGIVGRKRSTVVVRSGTLARGRDTLVRPTEPFLVDATVVPGNSGGPVVSRAEYLAIQGTKHIPASYLIGVVANYLSFSDTAFSKQTGRPRVVFEENSGLASVYSVDCITQTIKRLEKRLTKSPKAQLKKSSEAEGSSETDFSGAA